MVSHSWENCTQERVFVSLIEVSVAGRQIEQNKKPGRKPLANDASEVGCCIYFTPHISTALLNEWEQIRKRMKIQR